MRLALTLLLLAGCGSRTSTLDRGVDAADLDAGAPCCDASDGRGLDGGRRDAGGPGDTGSCTWVTTGLPLEVHRASGGVFVEPRAARASDGSTDLVATFVPSAPGGPLSVYAAQLDRTGVFSILSGRLSAVDSTAPVPAAVADDRLLVCETQASGEVRVQSLVREDFTVERTVPIGTYDRCLDVAGTGGRIGAAVVGGMTTWSVARGDISFSMQAPTPARDASVFGVGDMLVWAHSSETAGSSSVLTSTPEMTFNFTVDAGRQEQAPVLGPWPFDTGSFSMLARFVAPTFSVQGRFGSPVITTEGLPGQMFELPSPALANAPGGLLYARMNYGDLDPTTGLLELGVIDAEGAFDDTGLPMLGIRRAAALTGGEVSASGDADSVVVHWSEVDGSDAVTRALFLECR